MIFSGNSDRLFFFFFFFFFYGINCKSGWSQSGSRRRLGGGRLAPTARQARGAGLRLRAEGVLAGRAPLSFPLSPRDPP